MFKNFVSRLEHSLENVDSYRDKVLFLFIKPYWPRRITPNHVTWVRFFIAILLFILIYFYHINDKNIIIVLFIIGALSDLIDGPIARGLNKVTEFGALLDSTSDRALLLPIALYGLINQNKILLSVLIAFELLNGLASLYYRSREIYLESNIFGKSKMFLACVVFIAMLYVWPNPPPPVFIFILWLTIPFTLLSIFTRINELHTKQRAKT